MPRGLPSPSAAGRLPDLPSSRLDVYFQLQAGLLMVGAADGSVRVWRDYTFRGTQRLATAWQVRPSNEPRPTPTQGYVLSVMSWTHQVQEKVARCDMDAFMPVCQIEYTGMAILWMPRSRCPFLHRLCHWQPGEWGWHRKGQRQRRTSGARI